MSNFDQRSRFRHSTLLLSPPVFATGWLRALCDRLDQMEATKRLDVYPLTGRSSLAKRG